MDPAQRLLGRRLELSRLQACWEATASGTVQLAVLWGRRRVGKTFLLLHFLDRLPRDVQRLYHAATQQSEAVELRRFAESIRRDLAQDLAELAGEGFDSWEAALRFLAAAARREPLVAVIDEATYLTDSTPGFASIVQAVWDRESASSRQSHLMMVLTGSAIGTIEQMLGPQGSLHRRPTLQLRLDPFDVVDATEFLEGLDAEGVIEAYAACGGYPLHLLAWDPRLATPDNLRALAGSPGGLLLEDAAGMLSEELSDVGGYRRVLAAIGRGRTKHGQIRSDANQRVEYPLEVLTKARFVRRSTPLGAPRRASPLYEFSDAYLRFWFSVLYADAALIEGGQGRAVLERRGPQWQQHLGWVFEEAARQHCQRLVARGELPDNWVVGRWWASSGEPCEIDLLALDGAHTTLLGEVKWTTSPLSDRDLRILRAKAQRAPQAVQEPVFALWGRRGVTPDTVQAGVLGFNAEDVLR